jgi:hypothetical protein
MKRTQINPVRSTLRRGEPTKTDKEAARIACYNRVEGMCELKISSKCMKYAPLNHPSPFVRGQLCHKLAKRRFGWMESEQTGQRHIWGCNECHQASHNANGKPCPAKEAV